MEKIIKNTREVGTSAGVLLPKTWLNKQVVVTLFEPSIEKISKDVLEILLKSKLNGEAKGIYLYGSYSRGDFDFNSDIDVLVITEKTNKLILQDNYEILLVSESSFSKNIPNNLNYLSIFLESKVILNKELLDRYKNKKYSFNARKYLFEIENVLKINKYSVGECEKNKLKVPDGIVYSLVLRLRELYLIKCFFSCKRYAQKNFINFAGEKAYFAYLTIKRDKEEGHRLSAKEAREIIILSEKWLKELKELKKE